MYVVAHAWACGVVLHTRGSAAASAPGGWGGWGGSRCTRVLRGLCVPVNTRVHGPTLGAGALPAAAGCSGAAAGPLRIPPFGGGFGGWAAAQREGPGPPSASSRARAAEPPPGAGGGAGSPGRAPAGRGCPQAPSAPPPAGGPHVCSHACFPPPPRSPRRGLRQEPPLRVPGAPPGAAAGLGAPRGRWGRQDRPLSQAGAGGAPGEAARGRGGAAGPLAGPGGRRWGGKDGVEGCGAVRCGACSAAAPCCPRRCTARHPDPRTRPPHHPGARGPAGGTGRPGQRRPLGSGWARGGSTVRDSGGTGLSPGSWHPLPRRPRVPRSGSRVGSPEEAPGSCRGSAPLSGPRAGAAAGPRRPRSPWSG